MLPDIVLSISSKQKGFVADIVGESYRVPWDMKTDCH